MSNKVEKQPREYTKRQLSHAKKQARRQKIFLFSGIGVISAVVVLILAGWLFGEFLPLNKTIATVNDMTVKQQELIDTAVVYASGQTEFDVSQYLDYILQAMIQNMVIERDAKTLGITVTDEEIEEATEGMEISEANKKLVRASLLTDKLKKEYFDNQVPDSGNQVLMNAMLVESEELVPGIRQRLMSGDNFTVLADEYAVNKVSKDNHGIFDWHPASVLSTDISTSIPVDWAFSEEATPGSISNAISDNVSQKQLGYWIIKLNEKTTVSDEGETSANVSAMLVTSQALAERLKTELESGADLAALTEKYGQYSTLQQGKGSMVATDSDNISAPFNDYVFDSGTEIGVWSDPIKETQFWTKGGAWIVQVVDKSNDRPYSEADKSTLIDKAYTDWTSAQWSKISADINYTFNEPERAFALERINAKLK